MNEMECLYKFGAAESVHAALRLSDAAREKSADIDGVESRVFRGDRGFEPFVR